MTKTVTEDDVVLIRAGSGHLHLGVPLGRRGWDTMCCSEVAAMPHVRTWRDRAAATVWRKKARYRCPTCATVSTRPWTIIRNITGW